MHSTTIPSKIITENDLMLNVQRGINMAVFGQERLIAAQASIWCGKGSEEVNIALMGMQNYS